MARWRSRHLGATLSAAGLIWMVAAGGAAAGNNGTLKIHDDGPDGDPEQRSEGRLRVRRRGLRPRWRPDRPSRLHGAGRGFPTGIGEDGGDVAANGSGYFIAGPYDLASGHYKATLYGKDGDGDVKAKSKVFKVTCEPGGGGGGSGSTDPEN